MARYLQLQGKIKKKSKYYLFESERCRGPRSMKVVNVGGTFSKIVISYCSMISTIYFHPVTRLVDLENRRILLAESWAGNSK